MVNTKIRLIMFFAAKEGEALYSQQKQDVELYCGSDHELIAKFRQLEESRGNHLEKELATHSSTLAWKTPWTERSLVGCRLWGREESNTTA